MAPTTNNQNNQDIDIKLMLVSCGCGWGHAVPDMAIVESLLARLPNIQVSLVSYADGAEAYRVYGRTVTDLQMPRHPSFLEALIRCTRLMMSVRPEIVISHEEYAAVVTAHGLGVPSLFLTDFFMDPSSIAMQALQYTSEVLFLGVPGVFTEPPHIRERIHYVGRVVKSLDDKGTMRQTVRDALKIPVGAAVVLCQPGSWSEDQCPITDVLQRAWENLSEPKYLIWVGGRDYASLSQRFRQCCNVMVLKHSDKLADFMIASDILITKGSRQTIYEAAAIGLPSVSISNGLNWPDDVVMSKIPTNVPLQLSELTSDILTKVIMELCKYTFEPATTASGGRDNAAQRIALKCSEVYANRAR